MQVLHATPRTWTKDEYYRMAEFGLFDHQRVELIEGNIVQMTPQDRPHADGITHATSVLVKAFEATHYVRVQLPFDVGSISEPEPDFVVVRKEVSDAAARHPESADLVIEVAHSSLAYDREEKASLYARAGITDYWIMNMVDRQLEVHRDPGPVRGSYVGSAYRSRTVLGLSETVEPLRFPGVVIRVQDLF